MRAALKYIQKEKLSDQASKYIRDMIINKKLKSGERIVETKIAKQLGISQAPLREALRELEGVGLVEIKPYIGCTVASLSKKKLFQMYDLRAMVECHAIHEGIALINKKDILDMEKKIRIMKNDARGNNPVLFIKHDLEFHEILVKSANNAMLERVWRMVGAPLWSSITILSKPDLTFFANSHEEILQKVLKGNEEELAQELNKHFLNAANIVMQHFSDNNEFN